MNQLRNILFSFLALSMCACAGRARVKPGDIPPPVVATAQERTVAEGFIAAQNREEGHKEIKSGAQYARLNRILGRLLVSAKIPQKTVPIHLVDAGEEVNAMAVNSASMVVYLKLMEKVPDDDEIAVVLGHEIAHVLARHSQEEDKKNERASWVETGSSVLGTVASVATSAAGFGGVSNVAGSLAETTTGMLGYGALVGSFDRDQEYEADQIGIMLTAKSGYDPKVAINFWKKAEEIFGSHSEVAAFFSTHPSHGDRKKALEEVLPIAEALYQKRSGAKKS